MIVLSFESSRISINRCNEGSIVHFLINEAIEKSPGSSSRKYLRWLRFESEIMSITFPEMGHRAPCGPNADNKINRWSSVYFLRSVSFRRASFYADISVHNLSRWSWSETRNDVVAIETRDTSLLRFIFHSRWLFYRSNRRVSLLTRITRVLSRVSLSAAR